MTAPWTLAEPDAAVLRDRWAGAALWVAPAEAPGEPAAAGRSSGTAAVDIAAAACACLTVTEQGGDPAGAVGVRLLVAAGKAVALVSDADGHIRLGEPVELDSVLLDALRACRGTGAPAEAEPWPEGEQWGPSRSISVQRFETGETGLRRVANAEFVGDEQGIAAVLTRGLEGDAPSVIGVATTDAEVRALAQQLAIPLGSMLPAAHGLLAGDARQGRAVEILVDTGVSRAVYEWRVADGVVEQRHTVEGELTESELPMETAVEGVVAAFVGELTLEPAEAPAAWRADQLGAMAEAVGAQAATRRLWCTVRDPAHTRIESWSAVVFDDRVVCGSPSAFGDPAAVEGWSASAERLSQELARALGAGAAE